MAFDQRSFDQPLPPQNYTVAVAVESLSYSRNLENTVGNIVQSLVPGGVLIIVDDVVAVADHPHPSDASDNGNDVEVPTVVADADATLRPSLVPHAAWIAALEAARCDVQVMRDLSLEYQVALDHDLNLLQHSGNNPANVVGGLIPFAVQAPWEHWLASMRGNAASQRLLELQEERTQLVGLWERRRAGYLESASLSYHMYVCVKSTKR